jgi:flagellar motor switch protein FliG
VDEAQSAILTAAKALADAGTIAITGPADKEELVY